MNSTTTKNETDIESPLNPSIPVPKKRGKGRPPKKDLEAVKNARKGLKDPLGVERKRMRELKDRLLATGGTRILDTVIRIALDDGNPSQIAALKMCMDRMLPVSMFEKDATGNKGAVTINIVGTTETQFISHDENDPNLIEMEIPYAEEEGTEERQTAIEDSSIDPYRG